jgi:hypothetical protein
MSNSASSHQASATQVWKTAMHRRQPVYFDPETVSLLRAALADAWDSLGPEQQAMTAQSVLAEGILHLAALGERDPKRLRAAALMASAA